MTSRSGRLWALPTLLWLVAFPALAQAPVEITSDVVYGHKDGMALTFDVFRPAEAATGVGVIHVVSGGWVSTWIPPESALGRYRFLLDRGFTVFSVRHGSSPRYFVPEAFADVDLATRHINLHAADFGVDPDRLGVYGSSAGGHLSLLLGLTTSPGGAAPSPIGAVVAYFPPTDLRAWVGPSVRFPALDFARELAESVSPILHVSERAPPILLMHGDTDRLVPLAHSARLADALQERGATFEFHTFPGAGHGFTGEDLRRSQEMLVRWFEEHLAGLPAGVP